MPSGTLPETELEMVDDVSDRDQGSDRLPVLQTVLAGYRLVGEHFVSFAMVTILIASVHFSLMRLVLSDFAHGQTATWRWLLHIALAVASMAFASVVFAIFGIGWYRRNLAGERRRSSWFGPRELQFAGAMLLFYIALSVPIEVSQTSWGRNVLPVAYRLEDATGYPSDLFWPTIAILWRVLATAWLFFTLPAIALDIPQPLAHGMRTARRILPSLLLIYLIGLVPWFALDKLGIRVLIMEVDIERLAFASLILNTWIMTCTLALAGAAYGELITRETARRLSADFG
jgi:hypothetical protein